MNFAPTVWQREKDSNPHIQSQSLLCYLYTNPLYLIGTIIIILKNAALSKSYFVKCFFQLSGANFLDFNQPRLPPKNPFRNPPFSLFSGFAPLRRSKASDAS